MKNILVTGARGQLGSEIQELHKAYPYNFHFTDYEQLSISNYSLVKEFINVNNIEIIINCAAYTTVDSAEIESKIAFKINAQAVENMATIAKFSKIKLIHISTDYVFDGNAHMPYIELDSTNPQSIYGQSKLAGENAIIKINPSNSVIIRTSWLYSIYGNNFVKTMLRLGSEREQLEIISDQVGTPTYAKDLARLILDIIPKLNKPNVELYHYSNEGICSWFDFAKAIFELSNIDIKLQPVLTTEYHSLTPRPYYSVLNKTKVKTHYDISIPYWRDSLKECIELFKFGMITPKV